MKKIIILITILLGAAAAAHAQDVITTRRGEDINAKVLEVSTTEVKYKKASNPDGPTYSIYTTDIIMIRYENGDKDIFDDSPAYRYSGSPYLPVVSDGLKYRNYKSLYNPRHYFRQYSDPYSPGWSGVASAVIPGLGQALCDEWGRGTCFFLGSLVLGCASLASADWNYYGYDYSYYVDVENNGASSILGLASLGLYIWNICDAVRVAKIKNMHYQDLLGRQTSGLDVKLEPYLASTPSPASPGFTSAAGLSLKVNF